MATITRSERIRAYPNGAQRRLLDRWFGANRWLWNTALEIRSEAYRECELTLTGNDLSLWLTSWKRTVGHEWLALVPATCLTQCLRDQDAAFRNFFANRARYPRFKRRSTVGSLRFQGVGTAWARGLARAIHDAAFSEVRRQLAYKSQWYGKILVEVDRWYASSKRCSECHYTLDALRLDERQWTCPRCGVCHDRDIKPHEICWRRVSASWLVVTTGTCSWMRETHAQKKTFWCRCSQRKREAGIGIEPVWNRRRSVSSAVKPTGCSSSKLHSRESRLIESGHAHEEHGRDVQEPNSAAT